MKRNPSLSSPLFLPLLCLLCPQLLFAVEPHSINLGSAKLTPQLVVTTSSDSNIYLSNEDLEQEQSSNITTVTPSFNFNAKDQDREFYSNLSMTSGTYSDTRAGEDDYTDYKFSIGSKAPVVNRQTLFLEAGRDSLHDNRGTAFTSGQAAAVNEPDKYNLDSFGLKYKMGDSKSRMGLNFGVKHFEKEYTNNKITTGTRNYNSLLIDGTYFYRTQSKTEAFLQLSTNNIDYRIDNPVFGLPVQTYDGKQNSAFVGVEWKTTAKLTGIAKIGATEKTFDDPLLDDIDGTEVWELKANYKASSRALFNLASSATLTENEGTGTAKEAKTYSAGWNHTWPRHFTSNLSYALSQDLHSGSAREDDTSTINANLNYNFRRWMDIKLGHSVINRASSANEFEYTKSVSQLSLVMTL